MQEDEDNELDARKIPGLSTMIWQQVKTALCPIYSKIEHLRVAIEELMDDAYYLRQSISKINERLARDEETK